MNPQIQQHLESIFQLLLSMQKIVIPKPDVIQYWNSVVSEWIDDESMPLFVRKGGEIRGTSITIGNRAIIKTDNTPAHWIFKKIVFDKASPTKSRIAEMLENNEFPISFIRKRNEYDTLKNGMVSTKETRLNEQGWKLAHIERIAIKRGNNVTIDHYKKHHEIFLSLSNMYLIDKDFSGLAELESFNIIIKIYRDK